MSEQANFWLMTWHSTENVRIHKRVGIGSYFIGSATDGDVVLPGTEIEKQHVEIVVEGQDKVFYRDLTTSDTLRPLPASQVLSFKGFFVLLMPVPAVPSMEMINALRETKDVANQEDNAEGISSAPVEGTPTTSPETAHNAEANDPMFPYRGAVPPEYLLDDILSDDTGDFAVPVNAEPNSAIPEPAQPIRENSVKNTVSEDQSAADTEAKADKAVESFEADTRSSIDSPTTEIPAPDSIHLTDWVNANEDDEHDGARRFAPAESYPDKEDPTNFMAYELLPIDVPLEEESQNTLPKDWTHSDGSLSVQMHRKDLRFVPGERVRIPVSVKNNSPNVGLKLRVSLHGMPPMWKADIPPNFSLAPGEIKSLRVILYNTEGRPNTEKHVQLYIEDIDVPNIRTHLDIPVKLKQDRDLTCALVTPVLSDSQTGYVSITNHTQTQTRVALSADFDSEDSVIYMHENTVEIAPHQTVRVPYSIDAQRRELFRHVPHLYWIAIAPTTRAALDYPGTAVIEPIFTRGMVMIAGGGALFVVAMLALLLL